MQLPKSWKELTVQQFKDLRTVLSQESDSITQKYIDVLLAVTDEDIDVIEDLTIKELTKAFNSMLWIGKEPSKNHVTKFDKYTLLDFKKITWGMFIDLEYFYSKDYIVNLETITAILFRQSKENEWGQIEFEPYKYSPVDRGLSFANLPIESVYGVVMKYLDYRNHLLNDAYIHLFNSDIPDEEEPVNSRDKVAKQKEETFNKWAFENVTLNLAGDDILKMREVLELPLVYVLNILSMRHDLATP